MNKKHLKPLAEDLHWDYKLVLSDRERMIFERMMASLCAALAASNPRFDKNKFLAIVYDN